MGNMTRATDKVGRKVEDSDLLDWAVRLGLVAYGLVYLTVAWLAVQLAFGEKSGSASSDGALHRLARQPFGQVLIIAIAVGMFLLVLWRLLEATVGHRDEDGKTLVRKRLMSLGKAILYGSLAVSALKVALGDSAKGGGTDSTTAQLMNLTGGRLLVAGVGLAILAYAVSLVVRAWRESFREHLTSEGESGDTGSAYIWFGKAGYTAKGFAFGIVGLLFGYAAITHEARKSGGLDVALHKVLQQPFGPILLTVMAAGIACYGLFCFARARHLSR